MGNPAVAFRQLGRQGPTVSAIGLGCWAIGGAGVVRTEQYRGPMGYGTVDDDESIAAVRAGLALGCTFFDTASNYGSGHSEEVLGRALALGKGDRDRVVVATKAGSVVDETEGSDRAFTGSTADPAQLRRSCEASLRRLGTDYIDLLQFHWGDCPVERADDVFGLFDELVSEGKVRAYGWSTDHVDRATAVADRPNMTAIQHILNVFNDHAPMLDLTAQHGLASIIKGPLSSGLLAGRITATTTFASDDSRSNWDLSSSDAKAMLDTGAELRELFAEMGRTPAQGALGWVLARAPHAIPIPGFRNVEQVEDNLATLSMGPLSAEEFAAVNEAVSSPK